MGPSADWKSLHTNEETAPYIPVETDNSYGKGDIVGCGVDKNKRIFFTKNGKKLGN